MAERKDETTLSAAAQIDWQNDPGFQQLPLAEKHKALLAVDSGYKALPPQEQSKALNVIHYGQGQPEPSTYEKLTSPFDPGAHNPATRALSSVGSAVIGAPEAAGRATLDELTKPNDFSLIGHPTFDFKHSPIAEAAKVWWNNPKGALSVLPEALGGATGNVAVGEAAPYLGKLPGMAGRVPKMLLGDAGSQAVGDALVNESGRAKPLPRLVLGNERAQALSELMQGERAPAFPVSRSPGAYRGPRSVPEPLQGKPSPFGNATSSANPPATGEIPQGTPTPFVGPRAEIPGISGRLGSPQVATDPVAQAVRQGIASRIPTRMPKAIIPEAELGSEENPGWHADLPTRMPKPGVSPVAGSAGLYRGPRSVVIPQEVEPELGSPENPGWHAKLPTRISKPVASTGPEVKIPGFNAEAPGTSPQPAATESPILTLEQAAKKGGLASAAGGAPAWMSQARTAESQALIKELMRKGVIPKE
jgi:hypothetical protein